MPTFQSYKIPSTLIGQREHLKLYGNVDIYEAHLSTIFAKCQIYKAAQMEVKSSAGDLW